MKKSNTRPEAALFLSELDKTDRIADSVADRIEVHCPHEEPPGARGIAAEVLERLESALEPGSASLLRMLLKELIAEVLKENRTDISDLV